MSKDPEDSGGLRNSLYRKETRSKRRMTPMRRFVWRIVAAIGVGVDYLYLRALEASQVAALIGGTAVLSQVADDGDEPLTF